VLGRGRSAAVSQTLDDTLNNVRRLATTGWTTAGRARTDAAAWVSTVLADPALASVLAEWTNRKFGHLSDIYTRAMDGAFARDGLVVGADHVSPWLHRLFDGHHTVSGAWQAVRDALPDDTRAQELVGYLRALGSDLVTEIGLPLTTLAPEQFDRLHALICSDLGLSREWLIDVLHYNAVEIVAAALPAIVLAMGWNTAEGKAFARLAGSLGIGAAVAANPVMALVAVVMLAKAFHDVQQRPNLVRGVLEGGARSGTVLGTSALIGGPVGLMVGIVLVVGARRLAILRQRLLMLRSGIGVLAQGSASARGR
jgi:hypothetical protein